MNNLQTNNYINKSNIQKIYDVLSNQNDLQMIKNYNNDQKFMYDINHDKMGDIYLSINTERYVPASYYGGYYPYGCNSPYCRRKRWWYNDSTPFVWNNATRWPKWYYSPYTYLTNWYRDSYYYGMY